MPRIPAYLQIQQHVRELLLKQTDPEARIISERELCEEFGVTRLTARRALKELVESGWICVRPGKGMFINPEKVSERYLPQEQSPRICLIFGDGNLYDLDGFYMGLLAQFAQALGKHPARMRLFNFSGRDVPPLEEVRSAHPDAIIWVRPSSRQKDLIRELRGECHVEVFGNPPEKDSCSTTMDYQQAGRLAAEWFLSRKIRCPLFIGHQPNSPVFTAVYAGWREGFSDAGIAYDENDCIPFSLTNLSEKVQGALRETAPDGIFVFHYVIHTLSEILLRREFATLRKLPLLSDDNFIPDQEGQIARPQKLLLLRPDLAERAVTKVLDVIRKNDAPKEIVLPPLLQPCR